MKRLWNWFGDYSAHLVGLSAFIVIIAAIFNIKNYFQSEVIINTTIETTTMPPALQTWIDEVESALDELPNSQNDNDPYKAFRPLQVSGPLEPFRRDMSWRLSNPSRLKIDISNRSDHRITGVRLRLEHTYPTWGITLVSTFLTEKEIERWEKNLALKNDIRSPLVLPELPAIPPKSEVTVIAYGYVDNAEVSATLPGNSFDLISTIPVQDKGLVSIALRPELIPLILFLVLIIVLIIFSLIEKIFTYKLLYDLACSEAKKGHNEDALLLLRQAINSGYKNFSHMRNDPDLVGLQQRDDFKKLAGL